MGFGLWPRPVLEHSPVSEAIMKLRCYQFFLPSIKLGCNQTFTHQKLKTPELSLAPAHKCTTPHPFHHPLTTGPHPSRTHPFKVRVRGLLYTLICSSDGVVNSSGAISVLMGHRAYTSSYTSPTKSPVLTALDDR